MIKKGLLIPIGSLEEWKVTLKTIEEQTNFLWAGLEGLPTNMSDDAFNGFEKGDCSIILNKGQGRAIMQYGSFSAMKNHYEIRKYNITSAKLITSLIKRF